LDGAGLFFARNFPPKVLQALSVVRGFEGRFEESISFAGSLVEILGSTVHSLWALPQAYAAAGETEDARRALRDAGQQQRLCDTDGNTLWFAWVKLTGHLLVWKKRTVIASPSYMS
jgi:hypothetical protein